MSCKINNISIIANDASVNWHSDHAVVKIFFSDKSSSKIYLEKKLLFAYNFVLGNLDG